MRREIPPNTIIKKLTFVSGAIHYNASHHERQKYQPPDASYHYDLWVCVP